MERPPLAPCPGCERHVRASAQACPFCRSPLSSGPSRAPRLIGPHFSRAAILAGAALLATACGGAQAEEEEEVVEQSGGGEVDPTGGEGDEQTGEQTGEQTESEGVDEEQDHRNLAMPYGAPPFADLWV